MQRKTHASVRAWFILLGVSAGLSTASTSSTTSSSSSSATASSSSSASFTASSSSTASTMASFSASPSVSGSVAVSVSPSPSASAAASGSSTASPTPSSSSSPSTSPSATATTQPYQRSYPAASLNHSLGSASGYEAWTVTTAHKGSWAAFGPYATDVPLSTKLCAWFYVTIDNNSADMHGVAVLDVANRGSVLNQRYLQRQHFDAANAMQAFPVCFTSPSSSTNIGMAYRVWTPGTATLTVYKIDVTDCGWPDGYVRSYSPYNDFSHNCGQAWNQYQGWEVYAYGGGSSCLLAWGPYHSLTPGVTYKVTWTLALDVVGGSVVVGGVDVNNNAAGQLTSRSLVRSDFASAFTPANVSIDFTAVSGTYEYRVSANGASYMRHLATYVEQTSGVTGSPCVSMTLSPSPTPTATPSNSEPPSTSASVSVSPSRSASWSSSQTASQTASSTGSSSLTGSTSASWSVSSSVTQSATASSSRTASESTSASLTASGSPSASATVSATASSSISASSSASSSMSSSASASTSSSSSISLSPSATSTASVSLSRSVSASATASPSTSPSSTASSSVSPSISATASVSPSVTASESTTSSITASVTATSSVSPSASPSPTPSSSVGVCPPQPGHTCPAYLGFPEVCPAGFFCPDGVIMLPCPEGYICGPGTAYLSDDNACPAGSVCPEGSFAGDPAPPGRFSIRGEGFTSYRICGPGMYCPGGCETVFGERCSETVPSPFNASVQLSGGPCPVGTWCPPATAQPVLCDPGTWSNVTGLSHPCEDCPQGRFSAAVGASSLDACTPCPQGYTTLRSGATSRAACVPAFDCPAGFGAVHIPATSLDDCTPMTCDNGLVDQVVRLAGGLRRRMCAGCPPGYSGRPPFGCVPCDVAGGDVCPGLITVPLPTLPLLRALLADIGAGCASGATTAVIGNSSVTSSANSSAVRGGLSVDTLCATLGSASSSGSGSADDGGSALAALVGSRSRSVGGPGARPLARWLAHAHADEGLGLEAVEAEAETAAASDAGASFSYPYRRLQATGTPTGTRAPSSTRSPSASPTESRTSSSTSSSTSSATRTASATASGTATASKSRSFTRSASASPQPPSPSPSLSAFPSMLPTASATRLPVISFAVPTGCATLAAVARAYSQAVANAGASTFEAAQSTEDPASIWSYNYTIVVVVMGAALVTLATFTYLAVCKRPKTQEARRKEQAAGAAAAAANGFKPAAAAGGVLPASPMKKQQARKQPQQQVEVGKQPSVAAAAVAASSCEGAASPTRVAVPALAIAAATGAASPSSPGPASSSEGSEGSVHHDGFSRTSPTSPASLPVSPRTAAEQAWDAGCCHRLPRSFMLAFDQFDMDHEVEDFAPQRSLPSILGGCFSLYTILGVLTFGAVLLAQRQASPTMTTHNLGGLSEDQMTLPLGAANGVSPTGLAGLQVIVTSAGEVGACAHISFSSQGLVAGGFTLISNASCGTLAQHVLACPDCVLEADSELRVRLHWSCQAVLLEGYAVAPDGVVTTWASSAASGPTPTSDPLSSKTSPLLSPALLLTAIEWNPAPMLLMQTDETRSPPLRTRGFALLGGDITPAYTEVSARGFMPTALGVQVVVKLAPSSIYADAVITERVPVSELFASLFGLLELLGIGAVLFGLCEGPLVKWCRLQHAGPVLDEPEVVAGDNADAAAGDGSGDGGAVAAHTAAALAKVK